MKEDHPIHAQRRTTASSSDVLVHHAPKSQSTAMPSAHNRSVGEEHREWKEDEVFDCEERELSVYDDDNNNNAACVRHQRLLIKPSVSGDASRCGHINE
eukprot:scaffold31604_cov39-Cyclotella_meneghiniana.AAC.3